jgi:hypothetical protein
MTIAVVFAGGTARGHPTTDAYLPVTTTTAATTRAGLPEAADEQAWEFSVSAFTYVVPDDGDYVQPTFAADRDWLHLEARYNYEALDTASVWVGYNFSGGETLAWEITPMIGGVFGDTSGVAPGYKGSLRWWKIEVYSEGEYVFDADGSAENYFYNWSELTVSPVDWFRFGLVAQRTRAYESDLDIQRGVLVGFAWKNIDLSAYVFNPDEDRPLFVFSLGVSF